MEHGLITLADLPDLAGGKNRTTIAVARLDDNLRDPRYGKFKITQADVDGWTRNLADTFGGRVSIDWDHSSDRGGGTRAAGWITGLHQQGKLVTADVEFTPKGAKSIRAGDYRFISPTFVPNFVDEHGESRGRALIGAALTNRPVLRRDMPTLSLSRDPIDGVATLRKPKKDGRPMSKTISRKETTRLRALSAPELAKVLPTLSEKSIDKLTRHTLAACDAAGLGSGPSAGGKTPSPDTVMTLADEAWRRDPVAYAAAARLQGASLDTVVTLAQFAPDGIQHAGTIDWDPPAAGAGRVPPALDDSGKALHALIARHAASTGQHYFHAMADVTGQPGYRERSDIPPTPVQQGMDPERQAQDGAARALAAQAGIGWMDAMQYLDYLGELAQLQADDGSAPVPWLDSRPLASPPQPWSEDDWARDQRRANAAGIDIDKPSWQVGAELGRDVVGEQAEANRGDAIATQRARGEGFLDQARAAEDNRRSTAINDELTRRARNRVTENGRRFP